MTDRIDAAIRRQAEGYVGPHELAEMVAKERVEADLQRALAILKRGYDPWAEMALDDSEGYMQTVGGLPERIQRREAF